MLAVPRLRLSRAAFALAAARSAPSIPSREVLRELADAGALVRADDGSLLVDPALQASLRQWCTAAVTVEAVLVDGGLRVGARAAVAGHVAVCVATAERDGRALEPVEVSVPGTAHVVGEVLGQVQDGEHRPGRTLWLRVRGPAGAAVDRCGDDVSSQVRNRLVAALARAVEGGGSSWR